MKKFKLIIFSIFLFLCFNLQVSADGTKNYYIEANLKETGDMEVKELKVLDGTYNGIKTSLKYSNPNLKTFSGVLEDFEGSSIYNGSDITDLKVYDVIYNDVNDFNLINQPHNEFSLVNNANTGDYGKYTKEITNNGVNLTIYMPWTYHRASLVTYTIKDVAVVHNDIAEIAWTFIGEDYEETIDYLRIVVNLPAESKELRVFSHGPLNGTNRILNKQSVELVNPDVPMGNAIDMRVVFDKDLVSLSNKKSNINGLDNILEVEKIRADKANQIREEARQKEALKNNITNILKILSVIWVVGLVPVTYYIYKKYDKEYKKELVSKYYREIPNEYGPEIVSYLMYKEIKNEAFGATVLELIRKKILLLEEIIIEEKKIIGKKEKKDYKLTKNENNKSIDLTKTESRILNLLNDTIGDGKNVTLSEITKYSKNYTTAQTFMTEYNNWKSKALELATAENFYESNFKGKIKGVLYTLIMPLISFISFIFTLPLGIFHILNIITIIMLMYFLSFNKRSVKGNEEYLKWNALKNFLNDFGNFKDKEIEEIHLWERYLVYATVFGIADKVQEYMKVKLQDMNYDYTNFTFLYFNNWYFYHTLNNTMINTISQSRSTITQHQIATSSNSSSSGFGGGSSFGGGSFGGGGSGGGRF